MDEDDPRSVLGVITLVQPRSSHSSVDRTLSCRRIAVRNLMTTLSSGVMVRVTALLGDHSRRVGRTRRERAQLGRTR